MTTLLTGINGFLGSSLAADLAADGADVVGLDVTRGETDTPWRVETLDVRDRDALRTLIGDLGVESIIHCGGVSGPHVANEQPALVTEVNVLGTTNLFEVARELKVKAMVMVDSDLRSIVPEWVELLAGPILKGGYDFVAPLYARHKYDGTITNNLAYPLTRALYGVGVRQPIGGDFGFSGALARSYLEKDVWLTDVARFGIDVFMTTTAINEGYPVCQANLGAKVHDPKDPAASLGLMFMQVVGTLFRMMGLYEARWRGARGSSPAPRIGPPLEQEAEPVAVSLEALIARFRAGVEQLGPLWERVLEPGTRRAIEALAATPASGYSFPPEVWAHAVYDFAVAYNRSGLPAPELIDALVPLYYGRTGGLVRDTRAMDPDAFEAYVDAQARAFEDLKGYLLARWDAAGG